MARKTKPSKKPNGVHSTFGQRIKQARLATGMTQVEFARAIANISNSKCNKSLVSVWESDRVQNPQNATMLAISSVTGFSQQWLINGKGPEKAPAVTLKLGAKDSATRVLLHRAIRIGLTIQKEPATKGFSDSIVAGLIVEMFETLIDDPDTPDGALRRIAQLASAKK